MGMSPVYITRNSRESLPADAKLPQANLSSKKQALENKEEGVVQHKNAPQKKERVQHTPQKSKSLGEIFNEKVNELKEIKREMEDIALCDVEMALTNASSTAMVATVGKTASSPKLREFKYSFSEPVLISQDKETAPLKMISQDRQDLQNNRTNWKFRVVHGRAAALIPGAHGELNYFVEVENNIDAFELVRTVQKEGLESVTRGKRPAVGVSKIYLPCVEANSQNNFNISSKGWGRGEGDTTKVEGQVKPAQQVKDGEWAIRSAVFFHIVPGLSTNQAVGFVFTDAKNK